MFAWKISDCVNVRLYVSVLPLCTLGYRPGLHPGLGERAEGKSLGALTSRILEHFNTVAYGTSVCVHSPRCVTVS